jgi:death-on-curing protein
MPPRFLSMGEVLLILQDQIRRYGGQYGVRDVELLSSALAMPQTTFGGQYLHTDLFEQAAAYAFHLCQNHPFLDGNKRVALASALVFLDLNGVELMDPEGKLYRLMMEVSTGRKKKEHIARAFRELYIWRPIKKGRKPGRPAEN